MSRNKGKHPAVELVAHEICKHLAAKTDVVVAVDGRCASGKTTLAALLQEELACQVIHMDDFFLRPDQRTKERLSVPGGNVDYERFFKEVLLPLKEKGECVYRPYDCKSQQFKEPVTVKKSAIVLVEGSYSCHPMLWESYDLHIFLDVDAVTQMKRIRLRNGEEMAQRFADVWIPLEETYFTECRIREKCELYYEI